jgi:hypothetical protein
VRLLPTFFIVLTGLGAGSAIFASWLDPRNIRKSYFEFSAALSGGLFLLAALWQAPQLSPFLLALLFSGASLWSTRRDHPIRGILFLKASGLIALTFGLYSLTDAQQLFHGIPDRLGWLFLGELAAGGLLLGAVHSTMVLGHWYLIMRGLDFSHLQRAIKLFLLVLGIRALTLVGGLIALRMADPMFAHSFIGALLDPSQDLFFFVMRIFWGLLLPAGLGFMIWKCARSGSNQSATGLLYLAEVSVLIGETMAAYLKV